MIPLRDVNPSRTRPFVTYTLIVLNVLAFFIELLLGREMNEFIFAFGVVPARVLHDIEMQQLHFSTLFPFLSSMFLHGGWMHLIGNMLFLHVFGDNVEDRFGHGRFLGFYLFAGFAAASAQIVMNPSSGIPMIGASGAIAGVLGAYILMFPRAKVSTLIPIVVFFQIVELPAFIFLGIWFAMQMLSGVLSLGIAGDAGGVTWWAHIGGFAAGVIMLPFLRKPSWR